jgi:hypothetical protein
MKAKRKRGPTKNPSPKGMPGPTRTTTELIIDRAEMVKLWRRGWTQQMMADKFGVSQPTISVQLKMLVREVVENQEKDVEALIAEKRAQYAELRREAYDAWERSKQDKVREVNEEGDDEIRGHRSKRVLMREGRLPGPEYARIIKDTLDKECELLNLNPAKEVQITGHMAIFDVLCGAAKVPGPDDPQRLTVEEELKLLMSKPAGEIIEGTATVVGQTTTPLSSPQESKDEVPGKVPRDKGRGRR